MSYKVVVMYPNVTLQVVQQPTQTENILPALVYLYLKYHTERWPQLNSIFYLSNMGVYTNHVDRI